MSARERVARYLQARMESSFEDQDLKMAVSFLEFLETVEHMGDEEFEDNTSSDRVVA